MHRTAIVSDIHSNLEAFESVLEDIEAQGCREIVCLGDLIGYGPNPRQVLRIAMKRFRFCLKGNHEEGVMTRPEGFNWKASASAYWTRRQLLAPVFPREESRRMWEWLKGLPDHREEGDVLYVHASPNDPVWEYLMPEYAGDRVLMSRVFQRIRRVAFGGHTHLPGVFLPDGRFLHQSLLRGPFPVTRGKFFVNVGSVGQPRDQNPRGCYVIFDGETVQFRRVRYDFRTTARKISKIRDLPTALGTRLALGV